MTDLGHRLADGVHRSDVLVLLATEKLLTRPWCILELWEAVKKQIPVVIMEVRGRGWDVADACHLLDNLDTELPLRNPGALEEVQRHIDKPLAEVAAAMRAAIEEADQHAVSWTPHGTDNQVLAAALDLSDAMAAVTGRDLAWKDRDDAPLARETIDSTPGRSSAADADAQPPGYLTLEEPTSMGSRASAESSSSGERRGSDGERRSSDASPKYAVFVAHHRAAAGSDARFLHAQLERALGARCFLGGGRHPRPHVSGGGARPLAHAAARADGGRAHGAVRPPRVLRRGDARAAARVRAPDLGGHRRVRL